ncbi:unnamed protein product, partial [marine sediment metagenome]
MICENVQELEITNMIFNLSNSSINSNISQSFLNITNNITTIVDHIIIPVFTLSFVVEVLFSCFV